MQYQIPQFIDTEDKIAGPFTIRQFIYVCATGGILFALYFFFPTFLFVVFALLVCSITGSLAFLKVNGQRFSKVALLGFLFYWNPQLYLWQPNAPDLAKTPEAMNKVGGGINLESIISGASLKKTWQYVQTGSKNTQKDVKPKSENTFEVFRQVTGELRAAKRVDFTS